MENSGITWSPMSSLMAQHFNNKHDICSPACRVVHLCHLSRCWRFPPKLRQSWRAPYPSSRSVPDWMQGWDSAVTVHMPIIIYARTVQYNISNIHEIILCLGKKRHPFYFFVISLSDIIWFCQFLPETYHRKLETNMCTLPTTSCFIREYETQYIYKLGHNYHTTLVFTA